MIKSIFFFCLIQQIERKLASEVNQISVTPQCAYSFFAPSKKNFFNYHSQSGPFFNCPLCCDSLITLINWSFVFCHSSVLLCFSPRSHLTSSHFYVFKFACWLFFIFCHHNINPLIIWFRRLMRYTNNQMHPHTYSFPTPWTSEFLSFYVLLRWTIMKINITHLHWISTNPLPLLTTSQQ